MTTLDRIIDEARTAGDVWTDDASLATIRYSLAKIGEAEARATRREELLHEAGRWHAAAGEVFARLAERVCETGVVVRRTRIGGLVGVQTPDALARMHPQLRRLLGAEAVLDARRHQAESAARLLPL